MRNMRVGGGLFYRYYFQESQKEYLMLDLGRWWFQMHACRDAVIRTTRKSVFLFYRAYSYTTSWCSWSHSIVRTSRSSIHISRSPLKAFCAKTGHIQIKVRRARLLQWNGFCHKQNPNRALLESTSNSTLVPVHTVRVLLSSNIKPHHRGNSISIT